MQQFLLCAIHYVRRFKPCVQQSYGSSDRFKHFFRERPGRARPAGGHICHGSPAALLRQPVGAGAGGPDRCGSGQVQPHPQACAHRLPGCFPAGVSLLRPR
eukprot:scaffold135817_cov18-Prasinocladus_malaysianus.AAC.1